LEEALPRQIVVWVASMPKGIEIDPAVLKQPCLLIDGAILKSGNEAPVSRRYVPERGL